MLSEWGAEALADLAGADGADAHGAAARPRSEGFDVILGAEDEAELHASLALLRPGSGDRLVPLAEGQQLAGWTLTEIEPFRLVFRRDGDERSIELEYRED